MTGTSRVHHIDLYIIWVVSTCGFFFFWIGEGMLYSWSGVLDYTEWNGLEDKKEKQGVMIIQRSRS